MTPARSLAASVVALGFAGTIAAPLPANAAPAPCGRAENYAAQSGAEALRIDKLELQAGDRGDERPVTKDKTEEQAEHGTAGAGAADRILGSRAAGIDPTTDSDEDADTISDGIGILGKAVLDSVDPNGLIPRADDQPFSAPSGPGNARRPGVSGAVPAVGGPGAQGAGGKVESGPSADGRPEARGHNANDVAGGQGAGEMTGGQGAGGRTEAGGQGSDGEAGDGRRRTGGGTGPDGNAAAGGNAASGKAGAGGKADQSKTVVVREVGVGEARTALIGPAEVKSAAIARILDGKADGKASWTKPVLQQAPPTHAKATTRSVGGGTAGPLQIGAGDISAHARWDAEWACGRSSGEASRSQSAVRGAAILGGALVRVPEELAGLSTTALEGHGEAVRSVASATVTAGRIELADGRVKVRVLRAPSLLASMSTSGGGDVKYLPALIEVSGDGIGTKRLSAAGESAEFTLKPDRRASEAGLLGAGPLGNGLAGLGAGSALPLPHIPGVPNVTMPAAVGGKPAESAPAAGSTRVRVSLGALRQAKKGHAIAARATAISVSMEQTGKAKTSGADSTGAKEGADVRDRSGANDNTGGADNSGDRGKPSYGGQSQGGQPHGGSSQGGQSQDGQSHGGSSQGGSAHGGPAQGGPAQGGPSQGAGSGSISLDLAFGLMEAAAVAPEAEAPGGGGAGDTGGLPITGPQVSGLAVGGVVLLVTGGLAVVLGMRRRRTRQ